MLYVAACLALLAYLAPGRILLSANQLHNPAMRQMPQWHQFACVVLWPLTIAMARWAKARGR